MGDLAVRDMLERYGLQAPDDLPRGGIVGRTTLVDCVTHHTSRWFEGPYGFVLAGVEPLAFVAVLGKPGLFEVPEAILNRGN
jgi:hypothetical protein